MSRASSRRPSDRRGRAARAKAWSGAKCRPRCCPTQPNPPRAEGLPKARPHRTEMQPFTDGQPPSARERERRNWPPTPSAAAGRSRTVGKGGDGRGSAVPRAATGRRNDLRPPCDGARCARSVPTANRLARSGSIQSGRPGSKPGRAGGVTRLKSEWRRRKWAMTASFSSGAKVQVA